MGIY
jgi:hypothetical protein